MITDTLRKNPFDDLAGGPEHQDQHHSATTAAMISGTPALDTIGSCLPSQTPATITSTAAAYPSPQVQGKTKEKPMRRHQRHSSDSSTILVNGNLFGAHHPPPPPQPSSSSVVHTPSSALSSATKTTATANSHCMTSSITAGGFVPSDAFSSSQHPVPNVVSTSSAEFGSNDEEDSLRGLEGIDSDDEDIDRDMEELFGIPRGRTVTPKAANLNARSDRDLGWDLMQSGHNSGLSNISTPADLIFEHDANSPTRPSLGSGSSSKKLLGKTSRPKVLNFRSKSTAAVSTPSKFGAGDVNALSQSKYVAPVFLSRHASVGSAYQIPPPPHTLSSCSSGDKHRASASLDAGELSKIAAELSAMKPPRGEESADETIDVSENRRGRLTRRRSVAFGAHRKGASMGDMGNVLEAMKTDANGGGSGKLSSSASQRRIRGSPSLGGAGAFLKKGGGAKKTPPPSPPKKATNRPPKSPFGPPTKEVAPTTDSEKTQETGNGYDDIQIRSSEADPAPHQMELPSSDDFLAHSQICALMEEYPLVDQNFDLAVLKGMSRLEMEGFLTGSVGPVAEADLLGTTTDEGKDLSLSSRLVESHRPIVSSVLRVTDDLVVEGFYYETTTTDGSKCDKPPADRVEAAIFFSERRRQFIVSYRGPSALQAKAVRNRDAKKAKTDENAPNASNVGITGTPLGKKKKGAGASTTRQRTLTAADADPTTSDVLPTFRDPYMQSASEHSVFDMLDGLAVRTPFCDVVFTGHSFGAALATIAATRYARSRPMMRVSCHAFASPKLGTTGFRLLVNSLPNLKVVRVEYGCDTSVNSPDGPHWTHVGHTITVSSTTKQSSSPPQNVVRAYRFDRNRDGSSGGRRLSRISPGFAKQEKEDQKVRSYVTALERVTSLGVAWPVDFVGQNTGKGILRGFSQEKRLMV